MARNEIPSIERQIQTPNIQVKPSNAFADVGAATAELGQIVVNKLGEQAIYQSGLAGQKAAEEGRAPKTLVPPFNKATAAYNQAVINTESRALTAQGEDMMIQAYTKFSNPATFNNQTPAQFNAALDGITQGILDNTRPENRGAVTQALNTVASRARIKMLDDSISYDNKQTEILFKRELELGIERLNEASLRRSSEDVAIAKQNLENIYSDYSALNEPIKAQIPDIRKKIDDQLLINNVVADYIDAYAKGLDKATSFVNNLASKGVPGLTVEQQIKATAEVIKLHQQNVRLTAENQNELYNFTSLKIEADGFASPSQITSEVGGILPASSVYQLQKQWVTHNRAKNKALQAESIVMQTRLGGPQEVAKLPNQVLNDYYAYREKTLLNEANASLGEGQPFKQSLTLTEKMQLIVGPAGAPIPDALIDLGYGLKSDDPAVAMDAMNAYRYAWMHRNTIGDVLKGLDPQANEIAQYTLSLGEKSEVETSQLITQAQTNINDKSETTMQARRDRLQTFYAGTYGKRVIDGYYKEAFGVKPGQPEFDASFGQFQTLFDNYFMGVANGNADASLKMAQAQMRDWGTSKWGRKDDNMFSPPEKAIAYTELGHWFDNQVYLALYDTLDGLEKSGSNIKPPPWMKKQLPQGDVSEQDLFTINYGSTTREAMPGIGSEASLIIGSETLNVEGVFSERKPTALIDGVERRVYIETTKNTRTSATGEPVYQFSYDDDFGIRQYIPSPTNPLSVAQFTAKSMNQFIPEVYNEFRSEDFDTVAKTYARGEFQQQNKPKGFLGVLAKSAKEMFIPLYKQGEMVDELVYIQENLPRIKEEFEGRAPTPPAIEFKDGLPVVKETPEAPSTEEALIENEDVSQSDEGEIVPVANERSGSTSATKMVASMNHGQKNVQVQPKHAANIDAVNNAANKVGVPADVLAAIAFNESNFNHNAKPKVIIDPDTGKPIKNTAGGLFQFLDGTWEPLVKTYGRRYQITGEDGKPRNIKLGDKFNPEANAIMGALFTKEHIKMFKEKIGREPTTGEIYLMHFSPGTAINILKYAEKYPNGPAIRKTAKGKPDDFGFSVTQAKSNQDVIMPKGKDITITQALKNLYRKIERTQRIFNKSYNFEA